MVISWDFSRKECHTYFFFNLHIYEASKPKNYYQCMKSKARTKISASVFLERLDSRKKDFLKLVLLNTVFRGSLLKHAIITLSVLQLYQQVNIFSENFWLVISKSGRFREEYLILKYTPFQNWMTKSNAWSLKRKPKIILFQNWVSRNL